ncbi:sigma-54-dependent Fis family transcriptional regulator [bacterium]|nr:sigma-54-dependent Fis family transcriptional regulator [bacterium]
MHSERIMIVDDEKSLRWSLTERLKREGYDVKGAEDGKSAMNLLKDESFDLIMLDQCLPDMDGMDILRHTKEEYPDLLVIIITAYGSVDSAVDFMKVGAYDYFKKPVNFDKLVITINNALETTKLRREIKELKEKLQHEYGETRMVGKSRCMQDVFDTVAKIAKTGASTILITGESGTGKSLLARMIHENSDRASGPFMQIICSSVPETLLESELMGYEKGAFTDAKNSKKGLLELADGGTLFLDEVGDMPLTLQAKILYFLEERSFKRVGGLKDINVDVRVIAATNQELKPAIQEKRFREDLYYRLNIINLNLAPLRERKEEIPILADMLIEEFNKKFRKDVKSISRSALNVLMQYNWPGNIRELRNCIERAMLLGNKKEIVIEDLPLDLRDDKCLLRKQRMCALPPEGIDFYALEKDLVKQALDLCSSNRTHAARLLGMTRDQICYRIEKYDLEDGYKEYAPGNKEYKKELEEEPLAMAKTI